VDGRRRQSKLWLDKSRDTDYEVGQLIEVVVSPTSARRIRTESDTNLYGGWILNLQLLAGFAGVLLIVWGIVGVVRGR
jgi:hypothetical protein